MFLRAAASLLLAAGFWTVLSVPTACAQALNIYATGTSFGCADVEFDVAGNLYATGGANTSGKIYKIPPGGGTASLFVSSGLYWPWGLAMSPGGTLYVCDRGDQNVANAGAIYSVSATGVLTLFKGGLPECLFIVFDPAGNLYAAAYSQNKIIKISSDGVVSDYATGIGVVSNFLYQMSFDVAGNLYVGVQQGMYKIGPGGSSVTQIFDGAGQSMGHIQWADDRFILGTYGHRQLVYWSPTTGLKNLLAKSSTLCPPAPPASPGVLAGNTTPATAFMFEPTGMRIHDGKVFVGDYGCHDVRSFDLPLFTPTAGSTWGRLKVMYR